VTILAVELDIFSPPVATSAKQTPGINIVLFDPVGHGKLFTARIGHEIIVHVAGYTIDPRLQGITAQLRVNSKKLLGKVPGGMAGTRSVSRIFRAFLFLKENWRGVALGVEG
jgi:hypothetical protein